mmetsp:Transcript_26339/g.84359  ORF Transcript_26339/g.84359 Transcript_26339/m.84359 type:complete len:228 (-) Transcript_26339:1749-2432(-)
MRLVHGGVIKRVKRAPGTSIARPARPRSPMTHYIGRALMGRPVNVGSPVLVETVASRGTERGSPQTFLRAPRGRPGGGDPKMPRVPLGPPLRIVGVPRMRSVRDATCGADLCTHAIAGAEVCSRGCAMVLLSHAGARSSAIGPSPYYFLPPAKKSVTPYGDKLLRHPTSNPRGFSCQIQLLQQGPTQLGGHLPASGANASAQALLCTGARVRRLSDDLFGSRIQVPR